jgi:DinB family protein
MTITLDLRYPIGPFTPIEPGTLEVRRAAIDDIAALPQRMREAVAGLSDRQLDTPYRPGGWRVRQLVHHVADSHMNGFIRLKLALTESMPTIKPYDEKTWADLADTSLPIDISLAILDNLHVRWDTVYRAMSPQDFQKTFYHPELQEDLTLDAHAQLYGWHSKHHVAHITMLRQREGW